MRGDWAWRWIAGRRYLAMAWLAVVAGGCSAGSQTPLITRLERAKSERTAEAERDEFGRIVRRQDGGRNLAYEYDGFDRLRRIAASDRPAIGLTHDPQGRITRVEVGGALLAHYEYDYLGRVAGIGTAAGDIKYAYRTGEDGTARVIRTLPNGIRTRWLHGVDGHLRSIVHAGTDDKVLLRWDYTYRPDGSVAEVTETGATGKRTLSHQYDEVHRLTAVEDSAHGSFRYAYDLVGGRTRVEGPGGGPAVEAVYDWAGRLVTLAGERCEHNAAGSLTSYGPQAARVWCEYAGSGHLSRVTRGGREVHYAHDGGGQLASRTGTAGTTRFVCDPSSDGFEPWMAVEGDGSRTIYLWEAGVPLAAIRYGEVEFFLADRSGSVRGVADSAGAIVRRQDYDPFGVPLAGVKGERLVPGFAGLFYDPDAGLYLTPARGYDPQLGRFLQRDPQHRVPVGSQQDLSAYVYCGNDPVNYSDATGAEAKKRGPLRAALTDAYNRSMAQITRARDYDREIRTNADAPMWARILAGGFEVANDFLLEFSEDRLRQAVRDDGLSLYFAASAVAATKPFLDVGDIAFGAGQAAADPRETGSALEAARNYVSDQFKEKGADLLLGEGAGKAFGVAEDFVNVRQWAETGQYGEVSLNPIGAILSSGNSEAVGSQTDDEFNQARQSGGAEVVYDHRPGGDGVVYGPTGPAEPSAVGGVWLGGAAAALPDMGPLAGVAVDDNGRLILLSRDDRRIDLPPLRLDDIVTIFRCVYEHGQSPSVSIDNDPRNPNGPLCTVRHGPGTAATYVGWILFQCDRVLKCYTKGFDNFTGKPFRTRVPGFKSESQLRLEIEARSPSTRAKPGDLEWRRIWIMPSAVTREKTGGRSLTLLEVPLMLATKYREIVGGEFRDTDRIPDNSWGRANRIIDRWLTEHYDDVAEEFLMEPPQETGIRGSVKIFAELKRIATIAAVAETLAAQGVPMPEWMRSYPVRPCPVDRTSPWLVNVELPVRQPDGSASTVTVDGGVTLTPPDALVKTVDGAARVANLVEPLARATNAADVLQPTRVSAPDAEYRAVPLPGADTVDLGAARLAEVDLAVPFGRGQRLELMRQFNSFFLPDGPWGQTWSLDLPRLEKFTVRVQTNNDSSIVTNIGYRLFTPLDTVSATLRNRAFVPELGIETTAPDRPGSVLGMLADANDSRIGGVTECVAMRDGSRWHFFAAVKGKPSADDSRSGLLAAIERGPTLVAYRWDTTQRLAAIEGFFGAEKQAAIRLESDPRGRIVKATGGRCGAAGRFLSAGDGRSGPVDVRYDYDANGQLANVAGSRGKVGYRYRDGLVVAVERDGRPEREFVYGDRGRLERQRDGDGGETVYRITRSPDGRAMLTTERRGNGDTTPNVGTVAYDPAMRPTEETLPDGGRIERQRSADGTRTTMTSAKGRAIVIEESADGTRRSVQLPQGGSIRREVDRAANTVAAFAGDELIHRQTWNSDGQLRSIETATSVVIPQYDDDRVATALSFEAPGGGENGQWTRVTLDRDGRFVELKDGWGTSIKTERDKLGRPTRVITPFGTQTITRDADGRLVTAEASWGASQSRTYDAAGKLAEAAVERGGKRATLEFREGRPVAAREFDGAETVFDYEDGADGLLREARLPNGLVLRYDYEATGEAGRRLAGFTCGDIYHVRYNYDATGRLAEAVFAPVTAR